MITINRSLNLVIPLARGETEKIYVHAAPIRPETFELYHLILAQAYSKITGHRIGVTAAPSIAMMVLKTIAKETQRGNGSDWWEGLDGVGGAGGLLAEMVRLSNVITPSESGWVPMPLQTALDQNLIDEEEKSEVLNLLTFFTLVSRVAPRSDREPLVHGMAVIYSLLTTLSNATEYAGSLKTSTPAETIGENLPVS